MVDDGSPKHTFRSGFWRGVSIIWVIFVLFSTWDVARRGWPADGVTALMYVLAVTVIVYIVGWRPVVTANDTELVIANPLRTFVLPWNAVTDIDVSYGLRVHHRGGLIRAWAADRGGAASNMLRGASASRARRGVEQTAMAELARRSPADYAAGALREIWYRRRGKSHGAIVVRWAWPEFAVFAALVVVAIVLTVN